MLRLCDRIAKKAHLARQLRIAHNQHKNQISTESHSLSPKRFWACSGAKSQGFFAYENAP